MMYTVYNNLGQITKVLNTQDIELNIRDGESYIEGEYSDLLYYIENDSPVLKPEKPSEFHEFDYSLKEWVDNKPEGYDEAQVREQRDLLLAKCDWTQLPDVDAATSATWATYRQELRDITTQDGFPDSVTWPTKPA